MNQHLKNILELLQQNNKLSEADKEALLKAVNDADRQWSITDFKLDRTEKVKKTTAILLEETIEELEQKRKAVEAQNKELEIEAALEKVRSRSLAMHKSDELQGVINAVFDRLTDLGIETNTASIIIHKEGSKEMEQWIQNDERTISTRMIAPFHEQSKLGRDLQNSVTTGKDLLSRLYSKEEKNDWFSFMFEHSDFKRTSDARKKYVLESESYCISIATIRNGAVCLGRYSNQIFSEQDNDILKRFARVFEQAYTRFLDLQKAEAQAREAQIEAALERVRSRTMAMFKTDELNEVVFEFFKQMNPLGFAQWGCVIALADEVKGGFNEWLSSPTDRVLPECYHVPKLDHPAFEKIWSAYIDQVPYITVELKDAEKYNWDLLFFEKTDFKKMPQTVTESIFATPKVVFSLVSMRYGLIIAIDTNPIPEEMIKILARFAKVFEQTYTRFLDLQKAEAQARESQIQLALERVRARTMAMQKSDELSETVFILFQQFKQLGENPDQATIGIINEDEKVIEYWVTMYGNPINKVFKFSLDEPNVTGKIYKAWKKNKKSLMIDLSGNALTEFMTYRAGKGGAAINPDEKRRIINVAFFSKGLLNVQSNEERSEESIKLLERFASVFEQTYTRFLDLQKAEAQTREAQIQLALERVRARTMAMHNSNELAEVAVLLFEQIKHLGVESFSSGFNIWDKGHKNLISWMSNATGEINPPFELPIQAYEQHKRIYAAWKKHESFMEDDIQGKALVKHYQFLRSFPLLDESFNLAQTAGIKIPDRQVHNIAFFSHGYLLFITLEPTSQYHIIFQRFAKVFEQTYTRFLDLQKAEAQAREAQIEAALERVRSRTMAMQRSDELGDVAEILFKQVHGLGIHAWTTGFNIWQEGNDAYIDWITNPTGGFMEPYTVDLTTHPFFREISDAKKRGEDFQVFEISGEPLAETYALMVSFAPKQFEGILASGIQFPARQINHYVFGAQVGLMFITPEPCPEAHDIFKRFGKVFEQTYTRFLDLQKAEAQAREAQIEAALERVRSRTMAMQRSDELQSAALLLFQQVAALDVPSFACGFNIWDDDKKAATAWMAREDALQPPFKTSSSKDVFLQIYDAEQRGESLFVAKQGGKTLEVHYEYMASIPVFRDVMKKMAEAGLSVPTFQIIHCAFFSQGYLMFISYEPVPKAYDIFKRFAKVFEQTYTRFLDLKKAEAQAREAQVEAALEKVRGKAMGMHNSNDLSSTASVVFTELRKLGISPIRCGVGLLNKESRKAQLYSASSSPDGDSLALIGWVVLSEHPVLENIYDTWIKNEEYYPELSGEQLKSYYENLLSGLSLPSVPDWQSGQKQYGHFLPFSVGCLYAWSEIPYNDAEIKILKRFATIIDLTFRRYIELQKSEANAKEAVKQAALDRIRAEIASMRTISDLDRITPLIWNELTIIGVSFIRCGVFIMDDSQQLIHTFLSTPDGKAIVAFHIPYNTPGNIAQVLRHWHNKKNYIDHWDETAFTEFANTLVKQGALASTEQYLKTIPHGGFYLHFLPFLQGMLYVGNTTQLSDNEIKLIQSIADAFSTAYSRYEDFNKLEAAKKQVDNTLNELRVTQKQLIQSEKMASLGELTAGIAHEIQNPLNFVNNFSEVNKELLAEMNEEIGRGNYEEVKVIAKDVTDNEEKINHHGKRADAIVKGMLQHSRSSSGQKELTDINALADEYLRLAYHGLRAKDKSFNANMKTDYDETLEKVSVIPQDIGRVLLNLYNNAFYAVNEKAKQQPNGYEPSISVSTKKIDNALKLTVKDNGNGIPQKVVDKIFQPFFTTKPTGEGTGLGLSLSYDIIKAHGGEIKVEAKEGEGSEFIIQLPL